LPFGSTPLDGIDRLRKASPWNGASTPVIAAIGAAGVNVLPRFVDFACMIAWSWLSYQVT
jgi:hypothetical protein